MGQGSGASYTALSEHQLEALGWTMVALAILVSGLRYYIRLSLVNKLLADDWTHMLAVVCFIAMMGCYQGLFKDVFFLTTAFDGQTHTSMSEQIAIWKRDHQLEIAAIVLWFSGLWLIRLSFMLLYRQLFGINRRFMIAWWVVLAYLVLSYIGCAMFSQLFTCGRPQDAMKFEVCTKPEWVHFNHIESTLYTGVLSVVADFLIMVLPIAMLKNLKMRTVQKISLALTFAIALVGTAFDLTRLIKSLIEVDFSDITAWDISAFWVAIFVSAFVHFRAFLVPEKRQKLTSYEKLLPRSLRSRSTRSRESLEIGTHVERNTSPNTSRSGTSQEESFALHEYPKKPLEYHNGNP